jgi:hypothetical protein
VAFANFGADKFAAAGQTKSFGRCFVGFEFVFTHSLFSGHNVVYSFSHKIPRRFFAPRPIIFT